MKVHAYVMASKCINKSRKNFRSKQVSKLNAMPPFCPQSKTLENYRQENKLTS